MKNNSSINTFDELIRFAAFLCALPLVLLFVMIAWTYDSYVAFVQYIKREPK
jgi:hypothetical protein